MAINAYGASVYSDIVSVLAASVPSTPSAPTVATSTTTVTVSWTAPAANGA